MRKELLDAQVVVLTGHYGSGKSEVAINFAIDQKSNGKRTSIIDLDIANPYFRSREKQGMLTDLGIEVISNAYGYDITADLPALSPAISAAILNADTCKIIDVGGNDSGARVLNQFGMLLKQVNAVILCVVNVFRPETDNAEKVIGMIRSIEAETGFKIDGIINNSNLLRETKTTHILESIEVLESASKSSGIPVAALCCEQAQYEDLLHHYGELFPIKTFLRPAWLDR